MFDLWQRMLSSPAHPQGIAAVALALVIAPIFELDVTHCTSGKFCNC
jgi:hypothetical protein